MSTATPEPSADSRIIAIVGPTATGKSGLAERVAGHVGGEIVSADSMQVYRGMDIGTAKIPCRSRSVPYHCVDLVEPGTPFSAALYQHAARDAIAKILARSQVPVFCGGTGLYLRAALDDWVLPPGAQNSPERLALEEQARLEGADALYARLSSIDPRAAAIIDASNVRRVIRALEIAAHGGSYAEQARRFKTRTPLYATTYIGLTMEREALYRRIDERVDAMIANGLMAEIETLLGQGFRAALTFAQAIGYKELVPVIEARADLEEAVEQIKRATRRYAKRQISWFRADPRIAWIDTTDIDAPELTRQTLRLLESDAPATGTPEAGTWRLTDGPHAERA